ncbi:MAG: T9SS type A sorting domain-containing protein, partial [Chitinophagaceae bacterium]
NEFVVPVTINSAIALNVKGGICQNGNGKIVATAVGGNGLFEYTLNYMSNTPGQTRPNVIANTSGITTGVFTGVVSGIYTVTVTDKLGCTVTSGEVVANCNIPVTLSGEAKEEDALLNWHIPLSNIKHFNIQHSTDGINFTTIDTINAKNEKPFEAYHYVHLKPANQDNHYRLQIETKDGTSYFSNAVFVKVEKKITGLIIYPNPVQDKLHFQTSGNATAVLQILDATGKLVRNEYLELRGLTTTTLDVSNITNGVYHLVLIKLGVRMSAKFVKQ